MRIYVKISDELGAKLTKYATDFGMSKSGFVAYALGSHIKNLEYQNDLYSGIKNKVDNIVDDMSKPQQQQYDFSSLEK